MKSAVTELGPELGELTLDALRALVLSLRAQLDGQRVKIAALEAQLQACSAHQAETAALQEQVTTLQTEVQELRTRLGQDSANSSRPPSSDSPKASAKNQAKRKLAPTGRKRGGPPGHPGH